MLIRIIAIIFIAFIAAILVVGSSVDAKTTTAPLTDKLKTKIAAMSDQDTVPVIVLLQNNETTASISKVEHKYKTMDGFSGRATKADIEALSQNKNVKSITMDSPVYAFMNVALPLINGTIAHQIFYNGLNLTGANQTVCIIDSGIDYGYFNLGNCTQASFLNGTCAKVLGGFNYCNNTACTQTSDDVMDDNGHGTHVAGIIASNSTTYTGVAPDARIVSLKVLNSAGSNPEGFGDVIDAIDWCINNATKYNITVISMSLGSASVYNDSDECTSNGLDAVHVAIKTATENGIFVSIASGNDADSENIAYPSCSPNATSVGSVYDANYGGLSFTMCTDTTTAADKITCYSNAGPLLSILAPGSRIVSAKLGGGITTKDGTSMACPVVSGAAMLLRQYKLWESNTNLAPIEIKNAMIASGKNITDSRTGTVYPRLDIYGALLAVDTKAPAVTVSNPTATTYNYTNSIPLNFTAGDIIGLSGCKYNIDNGANTTLANCANTTFNTAAGSHSLNLFVTDKSGNTNTTVVSFSTDSTGPIITLVSPSNGSSITAGVMINFSIADSSLDAVWWVNNTNERSNITVFEGNYYINTSRWPSQIWQNVTVYANDTLNNTNSAFYRFVNNSIPRLLKNISRQNWSESTTFVLNLTDFFNDTDSSITYNNTAITNMTLTINQTTGRATIIPGAHFSGTRSIVFYANDGFATTSSDNATLNVTSINHAPTFDAIENKTTTIGYAFSYDVNATDIDNDVLNYSMTNVTTAANYINFTIDRTTGLITNSTAVNATGRFVIYLNVTDGQLWAEARLNVTVSYIPIYNNFMNAFTTNLTTFSDNTIQNVTNFTIGVPWKGLINFSSHNINLSGLDLDSYVTISSNMISVDSDHLQRLNVSARLTIYNLSYSTTPIVMRNGEACPSSICTVISYSGNNFTFDVTGFTSYSAATTTTTTITATSVSGGSGGGSSGGNTRVSSTTTTIQDTTTSILTSTQTTTTTITVDEKALELEKTTKMGIFMLILIGIIVIIGVYFYLRY